MDSKQKMNFFVTGATGFIGSALVNKLAGSSHKVHALVRSQSKTFLIKHPKVRLFKGDLLDPHSIHRAMKGCQYVFHTAAMTKIWTKNPKLYHDINITGTKNIMDSALSLGIKKVVVTSTAGVFGPSGNHAVHEKTVRKTSFFTEYEKTKAKADSLALNYAKKGMNVVIVSPTRVYGPGLVEESNSLTKIIKLSVDGRWPIIPGDGKTTGNYVYIDDVIQGHILAMKRGLSGEIYILGGENISYNDFFGLLKKISQKSYALFHLPIFIMMKASKIMKFLADAFHLYPFITPGMVKKLTQNGSVSSKKASLELGYNPTCLEKGIEKSLKWIEEREDGR
jgi:farnesol dehydrogenase